VVDPDGPGPAFERLPQEDAAAAPDLEDPVRGTRTERLEEQTEVGEVEQRLRVVRASPRTGRTTGATIRDPMPEARRSARSEEGGEDRARDPSRPLRHVPLEQPDRPPLLGLDATAVRERVEADLDLAGGILQPGEGIPNQHQAVARVPGSDPAHDVVLVVDRALRSRRES